MRAVEENAVDEAVIEFAREAGFGQADVRRLARMMEGVAPAEAEAMVGALVEERRFEQAGAVVVAAHLAGCGVGVSVLDPLVYCVHTIEKVMAVVRAVDGDPVDSLLDLWESGRMDNLVELALAYYIGKRCDPPPARAVSMLRLLCRLDFDPGVMSVLGEVVRLYDDPELTKIGEVHLELARVSPQKRLLERWVSRSCLDLLPERAARRVVSGRTVQRRGEDVGRNDPCPCGSGRKYKKCCLRRAKRHGDKRADIERKLTDEQFEKLYPPELIALDLAELTDARAVMAFKQLVNFCCFEPAARALAHLEERGVDGIAEHRAHLVERALFSGDLDTVRNQVQFMDEEAARQVEFDLLLGEEGVSVAQLASQALRVLRRQDDDEGPDEVDLAVALLRRHPPLGILVARGAMSRDNPEEADMLAAVVEQVRDKLWLPAGDRASEIRDLWAEEHMESELRDLAQRIETAHQREEAAEAEKLRRKCAQARRERDDLKAQLSQLQRELDRAKQPAAQPAVVPAAAASADLSADVGRLRHKIERLKGIIDQKNEERSALRQQVAALHERIEASPHEPVDAPEAAFDALEPAQPDASCAACALPRFDAAVEHALGRLPTNVVRRAVTSATELATTDTARWTDVKRLQTADVYTRRIGRGWRMFFRLEPDNASLVVLEIVSRQDFERALLRYR